MNKDSYLVKSLISITAIAFVFIVLTSYFVWSSGQYKKELEATQNELTLVTEELNTINEKLSVEVEKAKALSEELKVANEVIEALKSEEYIVGHTVTTTEINMLAKTVWGEARGCNTLEQSAVIWCILNRVDAGRGSIAEVITAPNQFHGYSSSYPVTDDIKALVVDVVTRWQLEKLGCGNVGRTLPSNYLYFSADGTGIGNVFRTSWKGGTTWNWDCWNPYS